ncbi:MAG: translation initiation factor IF-2 N-terminal domain-containing protein, partial [Pirellula sp.]
MAVRIYSLAKDLGIDSKELVDMCARIGIQGKGSALASLEDDEIAKIKSHLAERSAPAAEATKEPPKPVREPIREAPIREIGKPATAKREIGAIRKPSKPADEKPSQATQETVVAQEPDVVSESELVETQVERTPGAKSPAIRVGRTGQTSQESKAGEVSDEVKPAVEVREEAPPAVRSEAPNRVRESRIDEPSR